MPLCAPTWDGLLVQAYVADVTRLLLNTVALSKFLGRCCIESAGVWMDMAVSCDISGLRRLTAAEGVMHPKKRSLPSSGAAAPHNAPEYSQATLVQSAAACSCWAGLQTSRTAAGRRAP
jgi:hypothetical protein